MKRLAVVAVVSLLTLGLGACHEHPGDSESHGDVTWTYKGENTFEFDVTLNDGRVVTCIGNNTAGGVSCDWDGASKR